MLAAAKPDLDPDAAGPRFEQCSEIAGRRSGDIDRKLRQELIDQPGLMWPQLVSLAPPEERRLAMAGLILAGHGADMTSAGAAVKRNSRLVVERTQRRGHLVMADNALIETLVPLLAGRDLLDEVDDTAAELGVFKARERLRQCQSV